jgi:asparagine synthase (glutamine-hydrolysing)
MCGISGGVTNAPLSSEIIDKVHQIQFHRGPDSNGQEKYQCLNSQTLTMLHQRLAIIDINHGQQPMEDKEGSISIVFNGEIFNHNELRSELQDKGYLFKTDHSDTEVLIFLYKEFGKDMLEMLNGMFAFAIYDKEKEIIFLARDRVGIKPLYFSSQGNEFFFASELKTLILGFGLKKEVNIQSLANYLSFQFIPAPHTIIKNIFKLKPAHFAIYDIRKSKLNVQKYWDLSFKQLTMNKQDIKNRIFEQFKKSIKLWSMADVKSAISLSGGLDSSIIAHFMPKISNTKLNSFSLGFKDNNPLIDELPLAREMAKKIQSQHHEFEISANDVLDDLNQMAYFLDEPYAGGLPSWFIYKAMSGKVKVAFTGTGGDELFGNYNKFSIYESNYLRKSYYLLKRSNKNFWSAILDLKKYPKAAFYHKFFHNHEILNMLNKDGMISTPDAILENEIKNSQTNDARNFIPYVDFKMQLPEEFLHMTDRFSMAFSIEARTPLLDHKLIELVMSVSSSIRTKKNQPKYLLKEIFSKVLPINILNASKKGFVLPQSEWIKNELKELIDDLLGDEFIKKQGIFNTGIHDQYVRPHLMGECDNTQKIWTLVMFQLWYKNYLVGEDNEI